MLLQSHFIAFNDIKPNIFQTRWGTLQPLLYQLHTSISHSRIGQDPHLIYAQAFCRPAVLRGSGC